MLTAKPGRQDDSVGRPADRSRHVKFFSIVAFLVAVIVHIVLDDHPTLVEYIKSASWAFVPRFLGFLLDGLIVASLTFYLSETRFFKSYVEERVYRLTGWTRESFVDSGRKLLEMDFASRALDVEYLQQFDKQFLREIESSIRRAMFDAPIPQEVDEFLAAIDSVRQRLTTWRDNYVVILQWESDKAEPELHRLDSDITWTFVNYSNQPESFPQTFVARNPVLPNTTTKAQAYELKELELNGHDIQPNTRVTKSVKGGMEILTYEFDITVPPMKSKNQGISFRRVASEWHPKGEPWILSLLRPVHTLTISLHHPTDIDPSLFVFGIKSQAAKHVGSLITPIESTDNYHRWTYDGWMMPEQGAALIFRTKS